MSGKLNRRHLAALCTTLIIVGLIVLSGGRQRDAVGIGILGLAYAVALGSDSRIAHWVLVAVGLLLLAPPVVDGYQWPRSKREAITSQNSVIEADRVMQDVYLSIMQAETDKAELRREAQAEYLKQTGMLSGDQIQLARIRSEGVFRHVVRVDWGFAVGALLLFASGVGLIIGMKPGHPRGEFHRAPRP